MNLRARWMGLSGFLLAIGLMGCPAPGAGAKAAAGYAACEPIIEALERYRRESPEEYPDRLETLAPGYLAAVPGGVNGYPIEYRRIPGGYELQFRYEGPGMNVCVYTPQARWRCHGYY